MLKHEALIAQQFGATAEAYLSSAVHAEGEDLQLLAARIAASPGAVVLDLGCGAGHASYAVAPHAASVVACDPTPEMLEVVKRAGRGRGCENITTTLASAEALPFGSASFDWIVSRFSAHHWSDVPSALRQMRRVLKPGGRVLLIDTVGEESPLLDTYLQSVELLRDTSHIRNYSPREWLNMFREAGFAAAIELRWAVRLEFANWTERMRTPPERVQAIRSLWNAAPLEVQRHFHVEPDASFTTRKAMIEAGEAP